MKKLIGCVPYIIASEGRYMHSRLRCFFLYTLPPPHPSEQISLHTLAEGSGKSVSQLKLCCEQRSATLPLTLLSR